jgi:hypothetical protein
MPWFNELQWVKTQLRVSHFSPKKVMYNEYYSMQHTKILMVLFAYFKHKQKT